MLDIWGAWSICRPDYAYAYIWPTICVKELHTFSFHGLSNYLRASVGVRPNSRIEYLLHLKQKEKQFNGFADRLMLLVFSMFRKMIVSHVGH